MRVNVQKLAVIVALLCGTPCADAAMLTEAYESQLQAWLGRSAGFVPVYTKTAGDDSLAFHAAADPYSGTIALIEVQVVGTDVWQIVGGYNPLAWSSTDGVHLTPNDADRTAFIFNLSAPTKFGQKLGDPSGEFQTNNLAGIGPQFGSGADLLVNGDLLAGSATNGSYGPDLVNILGLEGTTDFIVGQMETYALKLGKKEAAKEEKLPHGGPKGSKGPLVPEPSSLVLLLTGGLMGMVHYRRRQSGAGAARAPSLHRFQHGKARMLKYALCSACCLALVAGSAQAGIIGPGDFSSSVTTINFDALSGGPTGSSNFDGDVITTQFSGLGVTFVNPNAPFQIYANNAGYLAAAFGSSFSSPNSAFIDLGGGSASIEPVELHFASPVNRIGFDFAISAQSSILLTLLDSSDGILETTLITNSSAGGLAGFIGLESATGASKAFMESRSTVLGTSFNFNIDNLRFEAGAVSAVPEPSSLALLGIGGLIGMVRYRRRQSRPA